MPVVFTKPTYTALCQICQLAMEWKVCQRDDKGNQGRWYAAVRTMFIYFVESII